MSPDILICGAGMAGVAAAYHLTVRLGLSNVTLVDEREPLTLTSDKGTEAYRNWWPGPDDTMVRFMTRSITLLEELARASGDAFRMNRRGYVYLTADPDRIPAMRKEAATVSGFGAGPVRTHPGPEPYRAAALVGTDPSLTGADLILDRDLILTLFPFLAPDTVAMLHARRCGWLDARALGRWMLNGFLTAGGQLIRDRVCGIKTRSNRLDGVAFSSGDTAHPGTLIIAAGPLLHEMGTILGLNMPVIHELHGKIDFPDTGRLIPPDIPMLIWTDPLYLPWSDDERRRLADHAETRWLTEAFPAGVHLRPRRRDGQDRLLGVWTYDLTPRPPVWPVPFGSYYAESVIRGLARMIPGMSAYFGKGREAYVDGGYYCKTRDNRPLIGPLPIEGVYVNGALSGFGVMGSQAAAELTAAHVTGAPLPDYAAAFRFDRFSDPAYAAFLDRSDAGAGQL